MSITPITNDAEHAAALAEIEQLWGAAPGTPEGAKLEALATLVEAYEEKIYPVSGPDPITVIEFQMEQMGLTRADLEPMIGHSGRVSEILGRKRPLTLTMIRKLSTGLRIPADILIQPYTLNRTAA